MPLRRPFAPRALARVLSRVRVLTLAAMPLSLLVALSGCSLPVRGSGVLAEDGFQINDFREVDLQDNVSLRVTPGPADEATLRCDDNLIELINVEVTDGVLDLGFQPGVLGLPRARCELEVHRLDLRAIEVSGAAEVVAQGELPALRRVEISGSGEVRVGQGAWPAVPAEDPSLLADEGGALLDPAEADAPLVAVAVAESLVIDVSGSGEVRLAGARGQRLSVDVSGSGDIDVSKVNVDEASAKVSGSGSVRLGGAAERVEVDVSGSGEVYARRLEAQRAVVRVSGSGAVEVRAEASAKVSISGSGDVDVWGAPEDRERSVSGSGDIQYH